MPGEREDRAEGKRDAERTASYFDRLIARGLSRKEACDLTVAYVMARMAQPEEPERDEEPWQRG